jgi:DNA topoisomerase VI subunit A
MTKLRAILPLLKAPITDFDDHGLTIFLCAAYGSPTTIRIATDTTRYDLRKGDVVTLYCEVLMKGPTQ